FVAHARPNVAAAELYVRRYHASRRHGLYRRADPRHEHSLQLGSVLLSGSPIVSLDNCAHDLDGQLLCQLTERPVVKIRILGRSEMPECECHTTVFATGNNISLKGDMVRRGLTCNLDTLSETPRTALV